MSKGLSLGADLYVTKPFSTQELLDQINGLFDGRARTSGCMRLTRRVWLWVAASYAAALGVVAAFALAVWRRGRRRAARACSSPSLEQDAARARLRRGHPALRVRRGALRWLFGAIRRRCARSPTQTAGCSAPAETSACRRGRTGSAGARGGRSTVSPRPIAAAERDVDSRVQRGARRRRRGTQPARGAHVGARRGGARLQRRTAASCCTTSVRRRCSAPRRGPRGEYVPLGLGRSVFGAARPRPGRARPRQDPPAPRARRGAARHALRHHRRERRAAARAGRAVPVRGASGSPGWSSRWTT